MQTKSLDWRWPTVVDSPTVAVPAKSDSYTKAERQMRRGKQLVISGFTVSAMGIVAYCIAAFGAGVDRELGSALFEHLGWLTGLTLGVIGLGTLLWLVGSFVFLSGAMDSDPEGADPYL